ncbi:uncharacterized protein RCO7_14882 [Rhynchosporium graminicola]|uniref:Uncharacterized protein n=1 Tax=Rhynchosporium graminicola TaxID=2792576 RepID=A0A1E1L8Q0_9HELO|nr:uncharacterized protein RCO7_14882 [Rhynchosporium commune]
MKSKARAKVNEEIPCPETYLRYAGEYTLFPELKCTLAPNSITSKYIDYIKKALKVVIGESSGEVLKIA